MDWRFSRPDVIGVQTTFRYREEEWPIVYVVDDDPSIREAVQYLLQSVRLRSKTFGSAAEFLLTSLPDIPSCLVLDVRLPGQSGLEFQLQLADAGIHLPIVFMTGYADISMTVQAMKAGAVDFLAKPFREQDMLDAVLTAIERDRRRRNDLEAIKLVERRFLDLTERERQVMPLVAAGLMNKQIAGELGLSEITIKIHRGRLMRKMRAKSVPDLVRMADLLRKHSLSSPRR